MRQFNTYYFTNRLNLSFKKNHLNLNLQLVEVKNEEPGKTY